MAKENKDKVNLATISQAHGALATLRPINDILGYSSSYKEASIEEYMAKITKMTDSDLHEHAVEKGIVPMHVRTLLLGKLKDAYLYEKTRFIRREVKAANKS